MKIPVIGVNVSLATAIMGVEAMVVFCFSQFQVCLSQSQFVECPSYVRAAVIEPSLEDMVSFFMVCTQSKKMQS